MKYESENQGKIEPEDINCGLIDVKVEFKSHGIGWNHLEENINREQIHVLILEILHHLEVREVRRSQQKILLKE